MNFFMLNQDKQEQEIYLHFLRITGALSNLYSDTENPFLYYRAMENIFCKAFLADNLSRGDVSADASKGNIGIGLKTFLHKNGKTSQKIAEFNKESYLFRRKTIIGETDEALSKQYIEEVIASVANMRNERLDFTKRSYALSDMIYHNVTRSPHKMRVYEEHMDDIDISTITVLPRSKNVLKFKDRYNEYSFSLSKNTLFKKFITSPKMHVAELKVDILVDPYEFLLGAFEKHSSFPSFSKEAEEHIILPLYSPRSNKVEEKSGLNQWNAGGRKRDINEVYIPIPAWIHKENPSFFNYAKLHSTGDRKTTDSFIVTLPNKKTLNMKVAQAGGKALMSDPNALLGQWILRDVLDVSPKVLVTKKMLDQKGIDSVKLTKHSNGSYSLDFLSVGSFEDYYNSVFESINTSQDQ